jgi:hypothetical protein
VTLDAFIERWSSSGAAERANKDQFLAELCDALGVPRPDPTTGDPARDRYVFECDAVQVAEGRKQSIGKIDLYKDGCFLLEAKQGSEAGSPKLGTAKRGTAAWNVAMRDAYGQALGYARTMERRPPFLITCDIGHCFDLYATFDGGWDYRPFPNAQRNRIYLRDLPEHAEMLRAIFLDPFDLDPARRSARVTREVAGHIAELARDLEAAGHPSEIVAAFLMRCLFTMFAEDVGLLPERLFVELLENECIPDPTKFPIRVMNLWAAMNEGGFWPTGKLLRFNGGLFADQGAIALTRPQLERLLEAARCKWSDVEPGIFGTLIERALDPRERHALGAHYTPRAYVERLVKPTIEEPLRDEWAVVQAEVRDLVSRDKEAQAEKVVRAFHERLCKIRVLDPACGSGNFLYVTLDVFKRLESEVLGLLSDLSHTPILRDVQNVTVTPAQFLGIEIKPWAKEIADLVLWIGYLQWHFRTRGNVAPKEPVLHDYKNIERRDAVLAYDREEIALDAAGKPITRWDGVTMKKSPVTGEDVPDESARIPVMHFVNPRKATWPDADFIVGNPPFIGNKRMRAALGDGYVEALRAVHDDVPETSDFVMYWWNHAAGLVRAGKVRRFGLITTNSITQTFNRKVVQQHLEAKDALSIVFAVPDHPWVDSEDGADVRIAISVGASGKSIGVLGKVVAEREIGEEGRGIALSETVGVIHSDLSAGPDVVGAAALSANAKLSFQGPILVGEGFRLTPAEVESLGHDLSSLPEVLRPYVIGRDLTQVRQSRFVIDFYGLAEDQAREQYPRLFQWILDRVKPMRDQVKRKNHRLNWWIFGEARPGMRRALAGLSRFIATVETSKYKPFVFLSSKTCPDHKLYVIASDDAWVLGLFSSRAHSVWALEAGGRLGVGNDPTWTNSTCFLPFPFPGAADTQKSQIRELGEALDAHRKRQQAEHPDLTITGMYNVLEKLRSGEALTAKEKKIHEQGLVSVLEQIHDDLDAAVFDAYGWPHDLGDEQILERLVALNAERAAEERRGFIRWLRPEFQNPGGAQAATQPELAGTVAALPAASAKAAAKWPSKLPEQISLVRTLVAQGEISWSVEDVARHFKGARREAVASILDSLAALGLLVAYGSGESRRWKVPARAAA